MSGRLAPELPIVRLPGNSNSCFAFYEGTQPTYVELTMDAAGRAYLHSRHPADRRILVEKLAARYGVPLTARQRQSLQQQPYIGLSIWALPAYLQLPEKQQRRQRQHWPGVPAAEWAAYWQAATQLAHTRNRPMAYNFLHLDERLTIAQIKPLFDSLQQHGIQRIYLVTEDEYP